MWKQSIGKKKEQKGEAKEEVKKHLLIKLSVCMKSGTCYNYGHKYPLDTDMTYIKCYYPFYKWFYFRESPAYTLRNTEGADIFIRSEIRHISFRYEKVV